ncbi:MAG: hypothetical protein ACTSVW_04300 [Candidatus Njordarchaeales archaeon]
MKALKSDSYLFLSAALLIQIPETYLIIHTGAQISDTYLVLICGFLNAIGLFVMMTAIFNYLRARLMTKREMETKLLGIVVAFITQFILFIWIFSESITSTIFYGKILEAFIFSQVLSIFIPLAAIVILSSR